MVRLLRRRESVFLAIAGVLGMLGLVFAYLAAPDRLTIAVGPAGGADDDLMRAFARQLASQHTGLRLKVVAVPDVRDAAAALDRGAADLAVIRPDVAVPETGLTLAILREAAVTVMAPRPSGITSIADLAGRKLGVVLTHQADPALVATLLRHFDLEPPAVAIVAIEPDRVVSAFKAGEVDAVALVAPPAGRAATEMVRSLARTFEGELVFVPIEEAAAIAERTPTLEDVTIPAGVWGGRPKYPPTELKTVGVSYRLMAGSDVDRSTVALLTQYLFQMRTRLSVTTRSANLMKQPDNETSTSAALPNHPGAVDYFEREQQTVMDRYSDWIYLVAFFGSGIVSVLAWVRQRFLRQRREEIDDVLDRLIGLLKDARDADDVTRLDALSREMDALLTVAVEHARTGATDSRATTALMLAIEGARGAIADRRRDVTQPSVEPAITAPVRAPGAVRRHG